MRTDLSVSLRPARYFRRAISSMAHPSRVWRLLKWRQLRCRKQNVRTFIRASPARSWPTLKKASGPGSSHGMPNTRPAGLRARCGTTASPIAESTLRQELRSCVRDAQYQGLYESESEPSQSDGQTSARACSPNGTLSGNLGLTNLQGRKLPSDYPGF
jgi:hypothetical protein